MIVVDIETSGVIPSKCGILQIGAVDIDNPENTFNESCRIDDGDEVLNAKGDNRTVFEVLGMTEEQMRDNEKQSQKELLQNFFKWVESVKIKNIICENPQFDYGFLWIKSEKYGLDYPLPHRAFDLHSIAQAKYHQLKGDFLIKEDKSDLGLTNILSFVGMKDERKAHNALEDAKLEAECFSRLIYGKNLIKEFNKFPIPNYLIK